MDSGFFVQFCFVFADTQKTTEAWGHCPDVITVESQYLHSLNLVIKRVAIRLIDVQYILPDNFANLTNFSVMI